MTDSWIMDQAPGADEALARGEVTLSEDFLKNRITGFVPHAQARGMDPNLDVPLIGKVKTFEGGGELWQGGCPDYQSVDLPEGFDYVLSLYPWGAQYRLPEGCERGIVTMYDSLDQGLEQVDELASQLADIVRAGGRILIHCQAGLNRSGLLSGATLVKLGCTGDEAVELLRAARCPLVLCNETFENHVRSLA